MSAPDGHSPTDPQPTARQAHTPADGQAAQPAAETGPGKGPPNPSRLRRFFGKAGRVAGRVLLGLAALILVLLLLVQTRWGSQRVGEALINLADPFEGATLNVERIRGNWITGLRLYDVSVTRDDSVRMVHIDTVLVRHRLLDLLGGTYHARTLYLGGPTLALEQNADTTWDLLAALPADTAAVDTTGGGFTVQIDQFELIDGQVAAQFYAPGRDSTARLDGLNARGGLTLGDPLGFRLDTLWATLTPPGSATPLPLQARAQLAEGLLTLLGLRLDAPESQLAAQGSLRLPDAAHDTIYHIDLVLDATPLALRDLYPILPTAEATETATLSVRAQGSADLLTLNAEATVSDGARVALDGEASLATDGPLTYRLDGSIRGLDPSLFTGDPSTAGRINATLSADLHGPALDSLSGSLRTDLFDTRYSTYTLAPSTLRATFTDGLAEATLRTRLEDANLTVDATLRPLDPTPVYDVRGRFDSLNVGRFVEGQRSNLKGTARLTGEGFDPQQAGLRATLDLDASRLNRQRIDDGLVTATLTDGVIDFDALLRMGTDSLGLDGTVRLGDTLRYQIDRARFDGVDVAALLGDTTRSAFTGTAALRGYGTDPASLTLNEVRLDLTDSFYGPHQIHRADLAGTLRRGTLTLNGEADLNSGSIAFDGTARPFDAVPSFVLNQATFANLDIGPLAQLPDQRSTLNGTLRLEGRGFDPQTMTLRDIRLTLFDSQLNDQRIDSTDVTASLEQGQLTFDARLTTPEGTTTVSGTGTPFAANPAYRLDAGRIDGLNLGALLGLPNLDTRLHGTVGRWTLEGTDPQTMTLQADLALDASQINQETITGGTMTLDLRGGLLRASARLDLERGRIRLDTLQGRLFDDRPTYSATGSVEQVDLARLTGLDTLQLALTGRFAVAGEGFDLETMRLQEARFDIRNASYYAITVPRLETRLSLHDGLLRVDTFYVDSNVAEASGGGTLALFDTAFDAAEVQDATFILAGTLRDEQPVRPFIEAEAFSLGEGSFRATATSSPGALRFEARVEVGSVIYNDIRILETEAFATGTLDSTRTLTTGSVSADLIRFSVPTLAVRSSSFSASLTDEIIDFQADVTVDSRRDARIRGAMELNEANRRIVLEDLRMNLDDDRWRLDQEATITYGDEYRVSNLLLVEEDQEIALDGVIDLNGTQSLGLTIYNFRIGSVADLLEFPGLGGTLNGDLFLTGPADAPIVDGSLDLDVVSRGVPVGRLNVGVAYEDLRLNLDASLTHEDESPLELHGYLPTDLRLSAGDATGEGPGIRLDQQQVDPESDVALRLDAEAFNIGWVEPFLDPDLINEIEGKLTAHVDIRGTLGDPVLSGEAAFSEGRLGLPLLGVTYTGISAQAQLADNQVDLTGIEVYSGQGSATGSGTIALPQLTLGQFNIDATVRDFRVINTAPYQADVFAALNLSGTTQAPLLTGAVRIVNADIRPNESPDAEFGLVEFTEQDVAMLERHFGIRVTAADTTTFELYEALAMDLDVELEQNVWLRSRTNPEMNILLNGSLNLQKRAYRDQQLTGTVVVVPERSYVRQFGRRFEIRSGSVFFTGPATNPLLNFEAAYAVPSQRSIGADDVTITMKIRGSLQDQDGLTLELGSEPVNLDQADIISYIATGRPAAEAFQLSGGGTLEVGTDLALSQLTNLIASAAGAELGLDVVEIQQEGSRGATVTAGKYLSRRLFAQVSWPISFSNSASPQGGDGTSSNQQAVIEYEVFNWLLIRITSDTKSVGFNVLYKYAY